MQWERKLAGKSSDTITGHVPRSEIWKRVVSDFSYNISLSFAGQMLLFKNENSALATLNL